VWAGQRVNKHTGKVSGVETPHVTCSTAEGTPFFLNLNIDDVGHTTILGPTGAGKSTLLNLLEIQFFKYPESQVVVFDKGRSCRQSCLAVGGLFYEPAGGETDAQGKASGVAAFQPLRDLETDRDILDAMDFIESLFTVNNYTVTPPMRAAIKETLELLREKPVPTRTLTSFIHYVNYLDPETKRPVFKDQMGDYLWDGGKYGKIFDARTSELSLDTRFLAIEMEALMNRGENCVAPALVYLFNLVEKKFDGRLTLLVMDEAWVFLKNETFADKIGEWLKVLRKKNVFVVFATQNVADLEDSPLKTTILQQCLTKIYLADPSASTPAMSDVYHAFGLTDAEIACLAAASMKRDYFYTSDLGRRMFQLDLGEITLGLIGGADHKALDALAKAAARGRPLCKAILKQKRLDYGGLLDEGAPKEPAFVSFPGAKDAQRLLEVPVPERRINALVEGVEGVEGTAVEPAVHENTKTTSTTSMTPGEILDAVAKLPLQKKKRDGKGRAAQELAERLGVSGTFVFQARRLLKDAGPELLDEVKEGRISITTAYRRLKKEKAPESAPKSA
jgi:type IV secretion system protein VirB4